MKLWRIAAETRTYSANDLSGGGAAAQPGRWNSTGEAVVYTATSLSLAVLETVAYVDAAGLPTNRFVVSISVPPAVWRAATKMPANRLPGGWDAVPAGLASISVGSKWLTSGKSALLLIPSVIVPEQFNVLISPSHPDAKLITATTGRRFMFNDVVR